MDYLGIFALLAAPAPQLNNFIGQWIYDLYLSIGNFGWTVVLFTVILKLAVSPLDVWQKVVMRKNQIAMKRIKPQMEKIQKQYGNDKQLLSQKQMALYKKEKYSTVGACLPMIATLAIFITVFTGFNAMVKYENEVEFYNLDQVYEQTYQKTEGTNVAKTEAAEKAVLANYDQEKIKFLWIDNVFMPDTWAKPVPTVDVYTGKGMGKLNIKVDQAEYKKVMKPVIEKYNTKGNWNGYLILPILAFVLNFFTSKLMQNGQDMQSMSSGGAEMQKAAKTNMKVMQWMMPIMMLVFSMLYSSAFTLYMLVSALMTGIFQLLTTLFFKIKDKKNEEKRLNTSYKA